MVNKESMMYEPYQGEQLKVQSAKKSQKKRSKRTLIREVILYLLLFAFCIYIIPTYLLQKTYVDGPSMENALWNEDVLLVDKLTYHFKELHRFDIIVFYPKDNHDAQYYVKRIIGLPGEKVQIIGETIYINDLPIKEEYGKNPITYAGIASEAIVLDKDEYFVLGDNRTISLDSRYEEVGTIAKDSIGGKVVLRIWPLQSFGKVH